MLFTQGKIQRFANSGGNQEGDSLGVDYFLLGAYGSCSSPWHLPSPGSAPGCSVLSPPEGWCHLVEELPVLLLSITRWNIFRLQLISQSLNNTSYFFKTISHSLASNKHKENVNVQKCQIPQISYQFTFQIDLYLKKKKGKRKKASHLSIFSLSLTGKMMKWFFTKKSKS
jgi:hypothetical protein